MIKRDEIVARQMAALRQYQGPRDKSIRVSDVRRMFEEMKNQVPELGVVAVPVNQAASATFFASDCSIARM
jgi:hypothetical protein